MNQHAERLSDLAADLSRRTKREETLAEEAAGYRGLPLFKQMLQFRAWLRNRKG